MTSLEKEIAKSESQRSRMVTLLFVMGLDFLYFAFGLLEAFHHMKSTNI